jgi:uncharacterized protein (TIGR02284 family)
MANDDVIRTLNTLVETCRDAERGFQAAANAMSDQALVRLFGVYAHQRAEFARELEAEIVRLGGAAPGHGSVAGALHRALINVRAAVSGHDERAVIAEAERGEDAAIATYDEALQIASLPADVRAVILRQAARVKETHDRLSDLKRAA